MIESQLSRWEARMQGFILCLLVASVLQARAAQSEVQEIPLPADPTTTTDVSTPPVEPVTLPTVAPAPKPFTTKTLRGLSRYTGSLHFSYLSTWIPAKIGLSGGYIFNDRWTVEGEYTSGSLSADFHSVDFGKITDRRYGLQSRWYPGANSFNVILGFYRAEFSAELGNTILNHMSSVPQADVWKFDSYGPQFGLSNRWQWRNGATLGVDWFVMYIPLFGKTDDSALRYVSASDRSDLDTVTSLVRNIPQFDVLKLTLGYTF